MARVSNDTGQPPKAAKKDWRGKEKIRLCRKTKPQGRSNRVSGAFQPRSAIVMKVSPSKCTHLKEGCQDKAHGEC